MISCTPLPFLLDIKGEISCLTFKVVLGANELNSSSDNSGLIKICFKKRNETKRRINLILFTSSEGGGGGGDVACNKRSNSLVIYIHPDLQKVICESV